MRAGIAVEAEVHPRDGLGATAAALRTGTCTIAYHGASVTVQRDGYRPRLHDLIRRRFNEEHHSLNASIGAIGPVSSVYLLDRLVGRHRPDLCLVEYSSRPPDPPAGLGELEDAVEAIVTKLHGYGCRPCVLHMYRADRSSEHDRIIEVWEAIAERRGVPTIDVRAGLTAAVGSGAVREEEILRDPIHTSPAGSELVAAMIDGALARLVEDPGPGARDEPTSPPRHRDLSGAHMLEPDPAHASAGGTTGLFRFHLPYLEVGPGEPISLIPTEKVSGLAVIIGPESGVVRVDGPAGSERLTLWDEGCWYERLSTVLLARPRRAGEALTIELTDDPVDYSRCKRPLDPPERKTLKLAGYLALP